MTQSRAWKANVGPESRVRSRFSGEASLRSLVLADARVPLFTGDMPELGATRSATLQVTTSAANSVVRRRLSCEPRQFVPRHRDWRRCEELLVAGETGSLALITQERGTRDKQCRDCDDRQDDHDHNVAIQRPAEPRRVERRQCYDRAASESFGATVQSESCARKPDARARAFLQRS